MRQVSEYVHMRKKQPVKNKTNITPQCFAAQCAHYFRSPRCPLTMRSCAVPSASSTLFSCVALGPPKSTRTTSPGPCGAPFGACLAPRPYTDAHRQSDAYAGGVPSVECWVAPLPTSVVPSIISPTDGDGSTCVPPLRPPPNPKSTVPCICIWPTQPNYQPVLLLAGAKHLGRTRPGRHGTLEHAAPQLEPMDQQVGVARAPVLYTFVVVSSLPRRSSRALQGRPGCQERQRPMCTLPLIRIRQSSRPRTRIVVPQHEQRRTRVSSNECLRNDACIDHQLGRPCKRPANARASSCSITAIVPSSVASFAHESLTFEIYYAS